MTELLNADSSVLRFFIKIFQGRQLRVGFFVSGNIFRRMPGPSECSSSSAFRFAPNQFLGDYSLEAGGAGCYELSLTNERVLQHL